MKGNNISSLYILSFKLANYVNTNKPISAFPCYLTLNDIKYV